MSGIPSGRVDALAQTLAGWGLGEAAVKELREELAAAAERCSTRPLPGRYPCVYLDGKVVPVGTGSKGCRWRSCWRSA